MWSCIWIANEACICRHCPQILTYCAWLSVLTQSCIHSPKDAHQAPGFLLLLLVSYIRYSWPWVSGFHNSLLLDPSLHPHSGNKRCKGSLIRAPVTPGRGLFIVSSSARAQLIARQACEVFSERRICKKMKNKTNTSSPSLSPKENSIDNGKGAHWAAFSENGTDYYQRRMKDHSGLVAQPQKRHLKVTWKQTCVQRKS